MFCTGFKGFLGGSAVKKKKTACQYRRYRRCRFNPWVRKIPWKRKWQPTPVFLPGKSMDKGGWIATVEWGEAGGGMGGGSQKDQT